MNREQLVNVIREKATFLCVGLDPDLSRIPTHLATGEDAVFEFNRRIIDATRDHCVAYKPNLAFYECLGTRGWEIFERTVEYIGNEHFIIADAKRGDIGNTATRYADAFFKRMNVDALTIAPYMGSDSVKPFLQFEGKWAVLLGLTSNPGASDFQLQYLRDADIMLYEHVLKTAASWGTAENLMYVIGATRPEYLQKIRTFLPDHFFLVPGVGAQGGDLNAVAEYGLNMDVGLLVNASRSILYAGTGKEFDRAATNEAKKVSAQMRKVLEEKRLI